MTVRPDPFFLRPDLDVLRSPAPAVQDVRGDVQAAVDRMLELLDRTGQPALSGPQVGYRGRVIVVDLSRTGSRPLVLINPSVEAVSTEKRVDAESCLHLPGVAVQLERPVELTVGGRARSGQPVRLHVGGQMGRYVQHQLDHLDGKLLVDPTGAGAEAEALRRTGEAGRCSLGHRPVKAGGG